MKIFNLKKSVLLKSSQEVIQITQALTDNFGINHFDYLKVYNDGSHKRLTTNLEWISYYYDYLYDNQLSFTNGSNVYSPGNILWLTMGQPEFNNPAREIFDIDNGITLIRHEDNATCFYSFGSGKNGFVLNNFYINNIDLLERYILYFKDKAHLLLNRAEQDRLIFSKHVSLKEGNKNNELYSYPNKCHYDQFIRQTAIKNFRLTNNICLTRQEFLSLILLAQGNSAKQIAAVLNLSHRTVETYLENIKIKTDLYRKSDLIQLVNRYNLKSFLTSSLTVLF